MASEPNWEAVKFSKYFLGEHVPDHLNASVLCAEVCTNVVCPCCALASMTTPLGQNLVRICIQRIYHGLETQGPEAVATQSQRGYY